MENSQFIIKTNGTCSLCFETATLKNEEDKASIFSVRNLCQYLKINWNGFLFNDSTTPSHSPVSNKQFDEIQTVLCVDCALLLEKFSGHFLELEVIQMKLSSSLKSIYDKMNMERTIEVMDMDMDVFKQKMPKQSLTSLEYRKLVHFRKETLERCSRKLSMTNPQVKIQRLTSEQINNEKLHVSGKAEVNSGDQFQTAHDTYYPDSENSTHGPFDDNADEIPVILNDPEKVKPKWSININPETGKPKCIPCSKEFSDKKSFRMHYKSFHLLHRYKCNVCDKTFNQRPSLRRHKQTVHEGVRFKCQNCDKTFYQNSGLRLHQRTTSCGGTKREREVHACHICPDKFSHSTGLQAHLKFVHFKRKEELCSQCGESFARKKTLKENVIKMHSMK